MPRNVDRDAREAQERIDRIIEIGFSMFEQRGIETVGLQELCTAAEVGVATVYKYFGSKAGILIAISARKWSDMWKRMKREIGEEKLRAYNAYELVECYTDCMIRIYREYPALLRFSSEYKSYINNHIDEIPQERLREHLDPLRPITELFNDAYERAKTDGCIRTDIPLEEIHTAVCITMLCMAERYAKGIVWMSDKHVDSLKQLENLKDMLLNWVKGNR